MFGSLGVPEILFILVVALLVFGPRRLPEIGRTIGKALGEFRRATTDLKRSIDTEVTLEEVRRAPPAPPDPAATTPNAATPAAVTPSAAAPAAAIPAVTPPAATTPAATTPAAPVATPPAAAPPEPGPDAAGEADPAD